MLDRIEPGWRALRSESEPEDRVIQIWQSGGGSRVPGFYKRAREDWRFHNADPLLDAGSERIVVVVDADHSHILNAGEDISRARHKIVLHPDLERIAPSALEHALVESIGRPLTYQEKQKLESWIKLGAKEFEGRIADEWNVYLKRQSVPKNAIAFSTYLAKYFPERQPNTPWERVWEACYRLLLLGTGPVRVRPLVAW